jgi:hypothetical protein
MRWWKIVGLAGLIGATAAGVAVGTRRVQRQRREYRDADVDELRSRLHERLARVQPTSEASDDA